VFWKIYFWINVLVFPFECINHTQDFPFYIIDLTVAFILIVGLFLYAYKMRLFTAKFWQIYFVLSIIWTIIYNFITLAHIEHYKTFWIGLSIGILLSFPGYIGIYFYSFKFFKTEDITIDRTTREEVRRIVLTIFMGIVISGLMLLTIPSYRALFKNFKINSSAKLLKDTK
jgi:hypothetical protein